jgi:TonB family protein
MRKALLATLALSPVLLHAQANSPAQPQGSVLESRLAAPNAIGSPAARTTRISTGVVAPKLVHFVNVPATGEEWAWRVGGANRLAVVSMLVDEKGVPSDLKIVRSAGVDLDANVLAAVKQYRFQPGTLDHAPVAVPVNLEITIQSPGR